MSLAQQSNDESPSPHLPGHLGEHEPRALSVGPWTREQFDNAVRDILGEALYSRVTAVPSARDVSSLCRQVAEVLFLDAGLGGTAEQRHIVRETMRRLHRQDGAHGLIGTQCKS